MTWRVAWLGFLVACGGSSPPSDAGDASETDAGVELTIDPPEEPALPEMACSEGFVPADGACDPFAGRPGTCDASDEMDVPGSDGCAPVSTACAAEPPDDADLFVKKGETGGDGTRAAPFGHVADAIRAAMPGDTIAIAPGRYVEALTIRKSVHLVGACATETIIASDDESLAAATVTIEAEDVTLTDLGFAGIRSSVLVTSGSARVERAIVREARDGAFVARGGDLVVDHSLLSLPDRLGACAGGFDGSLVVTDSVFEGCTGTGIVAGERGTVRADHVLVRGVSVRAEGTSFGLVAEVGGAVEARHSVIERATGASIAARGAGSSVLVSDCVIRDGVADDIDGSAHGLLVYDGGIALLERSVIDGHLNDGVFSFEAQLTVRDVVIRGTRPSSRGLYGRGLEIEQGTTATIERVLLEDNSDSGFYVAGEGTSVTGSDITVVATRPDERMRYFGYGAAISDGAHVEVRRVRLSRNTESGLIVRRADVSVEDLHIDGTLPDRIGYYGRGVEVEGCSPGPGVQRIDCADAHVSLLRAWVEGMHDVAVRASDPSSLLEARHLRVEGTMLSACGADLCSGAATGVGVGAYLEGHVRLDTFVVTDNALCGLQLYRGGEMDLHTGEVARNPVGVNVQTDGFDTSRLIDDVRFDENGSNLDTTDLPVPEAVLR